MDSARQPSRPFEATLPGLTHYRDDESGLRLRSELGEAGHRLDDEPVEVEDSLDLLLSLYSDGGLGEGDTVVCDSLADSEELEIPIEVELPSIEIELPAERDAAPIALEAAVAPQSESHLWEGFDGELGVFVATYQEHAIGTPIRLTLHLTHQATVTVPGTVRFVRDAEDGWPGVGVELDRPSDALRAAFRSFGRVRPSAFYG